MSDHTMQRFTRWKFWAVVSVTFAVASACGAAFACNVPVFRYALEHWRADPYRLVLVHRGALDEDHRALADELLEGQETASASYELHTVDVESTEDEKAAKFLAMTGERKLPAVIAYYPATVGVEQSFDTRSFDRPQMKALLNSPAREELVRRLAQGQTAVWLLLESGDPALDNGAAAVVETELKKLEQDLKLPELTEEPEDNLASAIPLTISFSLLRVPRSAEEAALVAILLSSETDLKDERVPLVFPVFGQGRALLPMIGKGITAENTRDYAQFLVGACSCEVKEQNPGFDLLLTADWDELLGQQTVAVDEKPAVETGPPQLVPIPPGSAEVLRPTDTQPQAPSLGDVAAQRTSWLVAAVVGVCLLTGAVLWPLMKRV